jgi:hypothetical protein
MRIAEMLQAMAKWLESPNNEALLLADEDEECLKIVAESCIVAASFLKTAAEHVDLLEPEEPSVLTPASLTELASIANAFDASGDAGLQRQASVIDELLLTIAADPKEIGQRKDLYESRIEEMKKKYQQPRETLADYNKIDDIAKEIKDSGYTKQYRILEAPLNTRYCPDHAGTSVARVGEHRYQCPLDKKVYDYAEGFTLDNGSKVPGGDVAQQTTTPSVPMQSIFDDRAGRLGTNLP